MSDFNSILYETKNGVATITLNRPTSMNAIDWLMPMEIRQAVELANFDNDVKIIVITGAGNAFCSGYDLKIFAESSRGTQYGSQKMPWDPYEDFKLMNLSTENFMSLWKSLKPTIAKINGPCVAGGSDIALCCDLIFMADEAYIGYPPARLWGCPTTAMWAYRLGIERAKNMLFTGRLISGEEAESIGLVTKSIPLTELDSYVDTFISQIISVPSNQLFFQKQLINNAYEMMGLHTTQRLAVLFDGMARHTPEGVAFQKRCQEVGFKTAVEERDIAVKSKI